MMRILLLILVGVGFITGKSAAQITIHPEVGFSKNPIIPQASDFVYYIKIPRKIDFIFGLSTQMPIRENLFFKNRISYSNRSDIMLYGSAFVTTLEDFKQNHLNIELSLNYTMSKYFEFGLGPSLIRQFTQNRFRGLRSGYPENTDYFWDHLYIDNNFIFGLNTGFSFVLGKLRMHIYYVRLFRENKFPDFKLSNNRFDLTVSYHLLGGNQGKTR